MAKEKSCLITQNLIGAVNWYFTAPHSIVKPENGGDGELTWKDKAWKDLTDLIGRVQTPWELFSEEAKQGIEFEKKVYTLANMENRKGSEFFNQVCDEVKGFDFGKKSGKYITVAGHKCYVYAKYDAIKDNMIKDIKTTKSYKKGKYLQTVQHPIYCFAGGADYFKYIIAEWEKYPKIKAVYTEEYYVRSQKDLEDTVTLMIEEALQNIKDLDLWDMYREKYCLY